MLFTSTRQLLIALILLSVAVYFWQAQWGLWSDVVFYVASGERLLAGGELYNDIIDMNPPLAYLVAYPPIWFAKALSLDAMVVFRIGIFVLIWISTGISWLVLHQGKVSPERLLTTLFALFLVVIVPAGPAFGQREHMALILILPYLVLAAGRVQGGQFSLWLTVLVGLAAAIGFGLKPFFVLPLVFSELGVMWLRRNIFAVVRGETVVIGVLLCVYLAATWVLLPQYFDTMLPLATTSYAALNKSWMGMLLSGEALVVVILIGMVGVVMGKRYRDFALPVLLALSALGFLVAFMVQRKGFYYHIYPSYALVSAALLLVVPVVVEPIRDSFMRRVLVTLLVVAPFVVMHFHWVNFVRAQRVSDAQLLAEIEPAQSVAIFSHDIGLSFPFLRLHNKVWASSFPALWPMVTIALQNERGLALTNDQQQVYEFMQDKVTDDLVKYEPDVVLIEQRGNTGADDEFQLPYLELFSTSARFAHEWTHYRHEGDVFPFEIWRRVEGIAD